MQGDALELLPASQKSHNEELGETLVEQLGDEVEVGNEGRLQDDGHVGGVEQLDGVVHTLPTVPLAANWQVHSEALYTCLPMLNSLAIVQSFPCSCVFCVLVMICQKQQCMSGNRMESTEFMGKGSEGEGTDLEVHNNHEDDHCSEKR